eukprot:1967779-Pyramimonas_sp.AAC.1
MSLPRAPCRPERSWSCPAPVGAGGRGRPCSSRILMSCRLCAAREQRLMSCAAQGLPASAGVSWSFYAGSARM